MPCYYDPDPTLAERQAIADEHAMVEAMLCGVLTVLEDQGKYDDVVNAINFTEMGIGKRKLSKWWEKHKAADKRRREKEACELAKEQERQKKAETVRLAMAKLSDAEIKALGLKRK